VVFGPAALRTRIEATLTEALCKTRDANALVVAVADMRARIRREKGEKGPWSIKHRAGGLVDAEFILQYLSLAQPRARTGDTHPSAIIESLAAHGALSGDDSEALSAAVALWAKLQQVLRLTFEGEAAPSDLPPGLKQKLARAAGTPDFAACERLMDETAQAISEMFTRIIDEPAARARPAFGDDIPH
jgi:glutamate-ammonia-ligase adenylyltransferase